MDVYMRFILIFIYKLVVVNKNNSTKHNTKEKRKNLQ